MQPSGQRKQKSNWLLIILIVIAAIALIVIANRPDKSKEITTGQFEQYATENKVEQIYMSGYDVYVLMKNSKIDATRFPNSYDFHTEVPDPKTEINKFEDWRKAGLISAYDYKTPTQSFFDVILPYIIFGVFSIILLLIIMRLMGKSNQSAISFGNSRARLVDSSKVRFSDVAGCDEEKQELQEIVDFLRNPQKFTALGARIPKGFLLVGPPGTGKTMLAKAVAGESNVPFYSITGSDFVEMFVGVGASRVRSLFEQAKKSTPCIVFIDEIDAVGRQRGTGLGGGNDEREQTLNQLLVEMDGFEANSGIVVIAATNRSDVLDPALLRPGRFDRQIYVYPPDVKGREAILKIHARNKPLDKSVNFTTLARLTTGFTGADIEMLLNEAAILAAREGRFTIKMVDLTEAINKVIIGPKKKSRIVTERDKKITAYHESGHAIVGKLILENENIQEVSIIPRGGAGGYTLSRPENDDNYKTLSALKNQIIMTMGGRAAEIIKLKDFTTGASGDIKQATSLAKKMVTEWGMSSLGPISYGSENEYFLGRDYQTKASYSEKVASDIDKEVAKIVNDALAEAIKILKAHDSVLENMAELLIEKETIFTDEIDALMKGKSAKMIVRSIKAKETREAKLLEKQAEEEKQIQNETAKLKKQQEALEAAKFLEEAGILKLEVKQPAKEKTTLNEEVKKDLEKEFEQTSESDNEKDKNKK